MPNWMMQIYLAMWGVCCGHRDKIPPRPPEIDWERPYDDMPWAEEEHDPDKWPDQGFGWHARQDNYWDML